MVAFVDVLYLPLLFLLFNCYQCALSPSRSFALCIPCSSLDYLLVNFELTITLVFITIFSILLHQSRHVQDLARLSSHILCVCVQLPGKGLCSKILCFYVVALLEGSV